MSRCGVRFGSSWVPTSLVTAVMGWGILSVGLSSCSPVTSFKGASGVSSRSDSQATVLGEIGDSESSREEVMPPDNVKMLPVSVNPSRIGSEEVSSVVVRAKFTRQALRDSITGLSLFFCAPEIDFSDATVSQCRSLEFLPPTREGAGAVILRFEVSAADSAPAITLKDLYHFKFVFASSRPAENDCFIANLELNAVAKGAPADAPRIRLFFDGASGIALAPLANTYSVLSSRAGVRARVTETKHVDLAARDTITEENVFLQDSNGQKHLLGESELNVFDFGIYRKLKFDRFFYQVAVTRVGRDGTTQPRNEVALSQLSAEIHLLGNSRSFEFEAQIAAGGALSMSAGTPLPFELTPK